MARAIWAAGTRLLREDPAFGPLVKKAGPIRDTRPPATHFQTLARAIVFQQLAGAAARTIHDRFVTAVGGDVTAEAVLQTAEDRLRGAGLSRNKLRALRDLASKVADGTVPLGEMDHLEDEAIIEQLTTVWGIGRWTAEMFLMFHLLRPDVWPVDDLGVRSGWARAHGLAEPPTAAALKPLGEPYRPWRSAVAWYCYRAVELLPPVG